MIEEAIARLETNSGFDRPTQFWEDVRELIEFAKSSTWEWGWVARFEGGEEYDSNECKSEKQARKSVTDYNLEEAYDLENNLIGDRLYYSVRKRRVMTPGPWEEVE